ncbi:DoxX family protein [Actinoplanes xinjiangensis]|uniref:DoxX family protein n=1 Tax=Actinoplanes xinjiangensis TaxID=512350 RepID=UPI000D6B5FC2|nr:DoxX family protein [Actinoplanes xinjiangensis]
MHIAYWVLAVLLAVFYAYAGGRKVSQSRERLQPMMGWVDRTPMWLVRTIGGLELAGAAGMILPPLTGIAPVLALAAAAGLTIIQVGGIVVHVTRGEVKVIGLNIALLVAGAVTVGLATIWL